MDVEFVLENHRGFNLPRKYLIMETENNAELLNVRLWREKLFN